ncbi:MAG TPA: hypothetical protein VK506_05815 [Conexibacter sp.]|nr:hypothetical protein [Conexibacter sp.]
MLRGATAATTAVALALAAGCGGDDEPDTEPIASYRVGAPVATFPAQQQLAHAVELSIAVKNTGRRTIPNVAATLRTGGGDGDSLADAFSSRNEAEGLASRTRPVWIVDEGPLNGDTAFGNTWALGSIAPGRTRTFRWRVVPVRAGRYELRYRLFGSTSGRSQLRLRDGSAPHGSLDVRVSGKPAQVRVTPDGKIVPIPPS